MWVAPAGIMVTSLYPNGPDERWEGGKVITLLEYEHHAETTFSIKTHTQYIISSVCVCVCVFTTLSSCSCAVHLFCGFCMWNGARELRLSLLHWLLTSPSKAPQWRFLSCYPTLRNPDAEKGKSRTKLALSALSPFCKCCNLHFLLCQHEEETISEGQGVSVLCDQRVCIKYVCPINTQSLSYRNHLG